MFCNIRSRNFVGRISLAKKMPPNILSRKIAGRISLAKKSVSQNSFPQFCGKEFSREKKKPFQKFLPQNSFPQNSGKDFSCDQNNVPFDRLIGA
jgi:hypothetical protein